nr:reverse transcriptase domain-containing protein [Tanacetum cinerariifolium]
MRTRSSSNIPVESPPNPSTSNPKRRNRRRSKQPFILEESPVDTMADQRTMAELLRAPTEGYPEAIMVPPILAEHFELKHSLINMMNSNQLFGLEKDNPHDHIRCFRKIEEICITYGGAHPYYQCLAVGGNTFPELRDNIQGYVAAATVNYNQGDYGYRPSGSGSLPSITIANLKGELKAITTQSGIVLDGPSVPIPPLFINPEEDEHVEETLTDQDLAEYTIKVPPPLVQKSKPPSQRNFFVHQRDPLHPNIPYPLRMLKQNELKCKALADLGACNNLMPLSVRKRLGLLKLITTRMTLEVANRAICTPAEIARDVFIPVGKFTFPADFVIVDYESDPRVPIILGRPFLRTAGVLIDVHGEEMNLCDSDERLTLYMRHDTSSYSNQTQKESINMINICDDSSEDFLEELFTKNHQSGNLTFSSHPKLTSPKVKNDVFDPDQVLKPIFPFAIPYDSFLFEIEPDQGKLTRFVMKDNLAESRVHVPNVLTTHHTLMLDSNFIPFDNSFPEFETFYLDIEEKNSGSTTIHADISLLDLECFNFDFKPDPSELTSIVDSKICKNAPSTTNVNLKPEEDHSLLLAYVVWIFLSFLMYLVVPPNLFFFGNEDTIFDPGIVSYHFPSLLPNVSHRCKTFMKFNVYPKLLNESPMKILSSSCSPREQ